MTACHRLVSEGVDLSAYNLAEMAADVEDLRIALGVDRWNLGTGVTWSTVLFEVMRRYPEHLRTVILDSPDVPQVDLFSEAIIGIPLRDARTVRGVPRRTELPASCPDLERTFATISSSWARRRPGSRPARGSSRILDSTVVRFLRQLLATGAEDFGSVATLPSIIDSIRAEASHDGNRRWRDRGSRPAGTEPRYAGPGVRPAAFSDGTFYWFSATTNCRSSIGGRSENWPEASRGTRTRTSTARISTRASGGRAAARDPHELVTPISPR